MTQMSKEENRRLERLEFALTLVRQLDILLDKDPDGWNSDLPAEVFDAVCHYMEKHFKLEVEAMTYDAIADWVRGQLLEMGYYRG